MKYRDTTAAERSSLVVYSDLPSTLVVVLLIRTTVIAVLLPLQARDNADLLLSNLLGKLVRVQILLQSVHLFEGSMFMGGLLNSTGTSCCVWVRHECMV